MKKTTAAFLALAAVAAAALLVPAAISASDHGRHRDREEGEEHERHEGRRGRDPAAPADPEARALYRKECGACHLDFPPRLLSAASHRQVMADLSRHYGQNAELAEPTRARLEGWLVANAGGRDGGTATGGAPRITTAPWFARKHRKVDAAVTARPSIKTLANCAACHRGAEGWDFDDDRVKIPAS
jgi:cytochrome c5